MAACFLLIRKNQSLVKFHESCIHHRFSGKKYDDKGVELLYGKNENRD